jgi:hypothetical protein
MKVCSICDAEIDNDNYVVIDGYYYCLKDGKAKLNKMR